MMSVEDYYKSSLESMTERFWLPCRDCKEAAKGFDHDQCEACWNKRHEESTLVLPANHPTATVHWGRSWVTMCLADSKPDITEDWQNGFNHAMNSVASWLELMAAIHLKEKNPSHSRGIDMWKSELLGRMTRGEEVRKIPCPSHHGSMWCMWGLGDNMVACGCEGSGWLPNEGTPEHARSKGYTDAFWKAYREVNANPPPKPEGDPTQVWHAMLKARHESRKAEQEAKKEEKPC